MNNNKQEELSIILDKLNGLEDSIYNMNRKINLIGDKLEVKGHRRKYTDAELYELKTKMSWNELSRETGISVSSLRYHVKVYEKENDLEVII